MPRAMTVDDLLREVGAKDASDVTIETLPNAGGADAKTASAAADKRAEAIARGECVAKSGGKSRKISADEASALKGAGAKDALAMAVAGDVLVVRAAAMTSPTAKKAPMADDELAAPSSSRPRRASSLIGQTGNPSESRLPPA
jgi:hypothetical protein